MNRLEHLLGERRTGRLFLVQSLPTTLTLLSQGLYQMVDTIYIGRMVGVDGLSPAAGFTPLSW